jgi:hypothetical protein
MFETATVTTRPAACPVAAILPALSICAMIHPPKMSPRGLVLQLQTQYLRDSLKAFLNTSAQIAQVATDTANEARQTLSKRKI